MVDGEGDEVEHRQWQAEHQETHTEEWLRGHANPSEAAEFIDSCGHRFAWSESNVCYEEVPTDAESFTLLRKRLSELQKAARDLYIDNFGDLKQTCTWDEEWESVRRLVNGTGGT